MSKKNGVDRAYTLSGAAFYLGISRVRVSELVRGKRFVPIEPLIGARGKVTRHICRESDLKRFKADRAKR